MPVTSGIRHVFPSSLAFPGPAIPPPSHPAITCALTPHTVSFLHGRVFLSVDPAFSLQPLQAPTVFPCPLSLKRRTACRPRDGLLFVLRPVLVLPTPHYNYLQNGVFRTSLRPRLPPRILTSCEPGDPYTDTVSDHQYLVFMARCLHLRSLTFLGDFNARDESNGSGDHSSVHNEYMDSHCRPTKPFSLSESYPSCRMLDPVPLTLGADRVSCPAG